MYIITDIIVSSYIYNIEFYTLWGHLGKNYLPLCKNAGLLLYNLKFIPSFSKRSDIAEISTNSSIGIICQFSIYKYFYKLLFKCASSQSIIVWFYMPYFWRRITIMWYYFIHLFLCHNRVVIVNMLHCLLSNELVHTGTASCGTQIWYVGSFRKHLLWCSL